MVSGNISLRSLLVIAVLGTVLALSAVWTSQAANSALEITAPANAYAHIYRPFPAQGIAEVVVEARMKISQNAGDSWAPSLVLYWGPVRYVAVGQADSGRFRVNHFSLGMSDQRGPTLKVGEWVDLQIKLTQSDIEVSVRPEGGQWQSIRQVSRPADMLEAPSELIIGKGYAHETAFPKSHLQNSNERLGDPGTSWVSDVRILANGVEVFNHTFDTVDGWQFRFDQALSDIVHFDLVSAD